MQRSGPGLGVRLLRFVTQYALVALAVFALGASCGDSSTGREGGSSDASPDAVHDGAGSDADASPNAVHDGEGSDVGDANANMGYVVGTCSFAGKTGNCNPILVTD